MIMIPFILILMWCIITEKSDFQRMKESDKLPPFTRQEAFDYYNQIIKKRTNEQQ